MNSGRRATETPDHNRLQALFLDDLYRQAFCRVAKPGWEDRIWSDFVAEASYQAREVHPEFRETLERLPVVCWPNVSTRAWFEIKGIDVGIEMNIEIQRLTNDTTIPALCLPYALRCPGEKDTFTVEIKGDVGDEYPTVLRQMLALKSRYLFLESYSGFGATTEEFIGIFESSGRSVVWKDDVDAEFRQPDVFRRRFLDNSLMIGGVRVAEAAHVLDAMSKYDVMFDHAMRLIEMSNSAMKEGDFRWSVRLFSDALAMLRVIHEFETFKRHHGLHL